MKEDDKWIRQMRKQLEDYSEPLPTGLWEEIEKDLNQPALQPKVVPLWKRWQAVAAVVAVVLVSSTAVWRRAFRRWLRCLLCQRFGR